MNDLLFYTLLIVLLYYFFYYLPSQKKTNQPSTQPFPIVNTKATQTETIIEETSSTITGPGVVSFPGPEQKKVQETSQNQTKLKKDISSLNKKIKEYEEVSNQSLILIDNLEKKVSEKDKQIKNLEKDYQEREEQIKEWKDTQQKKLDKLIKQKTELEKENERLKKTPSPSHSKPKPPQPKKPTPPNPPKMPGEWNEE